MRAVTFAVTFGAILVGVHQGKELIYTGKVGTGFDTKMLRELPARLDELEIASAPFTSGSGLPRSAHWVKPEVVVQVGFIEWTTHGKLRHPRLLGLRVDKAPRDVIRELVGAFPSLVLAEGEYVVIARHESKVYQSTFQVQTGMDRDVEVVAEENGKQGP